MVSRPSNGRGIDALERVEVESRAEWRRWLEEHHGQGEGVWVVACKRGDARHVPYADVRDEALCFGWIDSRPAKLDAQRTMLLLSPRKSGSGWSRVNKERIAALDAAHALVVPTDLAEALASRAPAALRFGAFPPSARRGILEWIEAAKRPETRAKRVAETAELAARDERANHGRRTPEQG